MFVHRLQRQKIFLAIGGAEKDDILSSALSISTTLLHKSALLRPHEWGTRGHHSTLLILCKLLYRT